MLCAFAISANAMASGVCQQVSDWQDSNIMANNSQAIQYQVTITRQTIANQFIQSTDYLWGDTSGAIHPLATCQVLDQYLQTLNSIRMEIKALDLAPNLPERSVLLISR